MWPDPYPKGAIKSASIKNPEDDEAVSEEDFIAIYTDTVTNPNFVQMEPTDGRPHIPLNIEITEKSYAWSYSYADDFILFDMAIKNIGHKLLNKVYMGLYMDGDVRKVNYRWAEEQDDISGFRRAIDSPFGCNWVDTINLAWLSDNNGLYEAGGQDECPFNTGNYTGVTGVRVVRTPSDSLKYSFNWWISNPNPRLDFGPRKVGTPENPFRDFGGLLGTPLGDPNKYYIMSHEEFDYDQLFSAKDHTSEGWLPRGPDAEDFADGFDTHYLLSFGPFDISPGEVLPLSFAYVAGENFFSDCEAYERVFDPAFPEEYYNTLDFSEIGLNAIWASYIYDNPGVDTDGDGYRGKFRICSDDSTFWDTVYYEGDGVPDFKGASPPPPPELWVINPYPVGDTVRSLVTPSVNETNGGEVSLQWYGYRSETTKDPFTGLLDFEGYRVWLSLSDRRSEFYTLCSYDRRDFNRYVYNSSRNSWELNDPPFTIDMLRTIYGDTFDPQNFDRDHPLYWQGASYYFTSQDWNQSDLDDTTMIHKIYPHQSPPSTLSHDSAAIYYPDELTEDGYFKYYMYEYKIHNLLPSQKYYFAVTAFDYGSPAGNLEFLETEPNRNYIAEYPQNQNRVVVSSNLNVTVYPNPYRIDANYRANGLEGRDTPDMHDERIHRIHFTNLPNKCTIRIFSLDGDLIREIRHDYPPDYPESMHDEWDLITRNTQAVVAGIYYYTVESEFGNQIGKLVIIK